MTRAAWFGDRLVAVTHVAIKMLWPGNGPGEFDLENTVQRTLSLDASGRLVIERLSILDPYPGGSTTRTLELPNSWKCMYAKDPLRAVRSVLRMHGSTDVTTTVRP